MAGTGSGGSKRGRGGGMITGINMTPLVDISLVLLIIFMVTASYVAALTIKVELPKAQTGEETDDVTLAITIDKAGRPYLNGQPTDESGLRAKIGEELKLKKDVQVVISADKGVTHGVVVHYIDVTKQLGVVKFALNIEAE